MKAISSYLLLFFSLLLIAIPANAAFEDIDVIVPEGKQINCPYFSMTAQTTCQYIAFGSSLKEFGHIGCIDNSNKDKKFLIQTIFHNYDYIDVADTLIRDEIIKHNSPKDKRTLLSKTDVIMDELRAKIIKYKGESSQVDETKKPYTLYEITYDAVVDIFYTPPINHANSLIITCINESIGKPVDETEAEKICMKYFESFKLKNNKIRQKCNCKK